MPAKLLLLLLFVATGLSFLDRQVLSITIIKIQAAFQISDVQYGFINTVFLISYAIMFTLGGRLIDTIGPRKGLAFSVGIWSVANCLHGVMRNYPQLLAFRFMLGAGEGGCFPGAARAVYEWFSEKDRGFANGIAIGGSAIGAVVAPPLTIYLSGHFGWRWSFVVPGLVGVLWVVAWLSLKWKPEAAREAAVVVRKDVLPMSVLLRQKETIIFILIRFLLDPVVYFIMFWAPKFLHEQRGLAFEAVGHLFWIPFLCLGLANMLGGYCSDRLVRRGLSVNKARKMIMGFAALLTTGAPFIGIASSVALGIGLMSLLMLAHGFWITNYITAISDMFGSRGTSTVVGLSGTAGALSGLIINPLIGGWVQHYSYTPIWIVAGLMYPLAWLLLMGTVRVIRPLALG